MRSDHIDTGYYMLIICMDIVCAPSVSTIIHSYGKGYTDRALNIKHQTLYRDLVQPDKITRN